MQSVQIAQASDNVTVDLLSEGIVRITLKPGARMTAQDGAFARDTLLALTGGAPSLVMLRITGVGSVSREAISFYSGASTIHAFAIVGATPVDRVIAHALRGLPQPPCPTQFFTSTQDALEWLYGHAPEYDLGSMPR